MVSSAEDAAPTKRGGQLLVTLKSKHRKVITIGNSHCLARVVDDDVDPEICYSLKTTDAALATKLDIVC